MFGARTLDGGRILAERGGERSSVEQIGREPLALGKGLIMQLS